jgi:pyruvate/2-oxoglutarate dehydrogenase complex dihydrolipoamide acyltransferase (E2) component
MKQTTMLISILAIIACGGKKPPEEPKEPEPEAATPAAAAEDKPATEPPPALEPEPAPKASKAQADLAPNKGVRIKGTTVTFTQQEGQPIAVASAGWFDGIKAGKYHLVVHQGADCGKNAAKTGKATEGGDIPFTATKSTDSLSVDPVATLQLEGDRAIVGHTLVLHEDKRGKPGKALACGTISTGVDP